MSSFTARRVVRSSSTAKPLSSEPLGPGNNATIINYGTKYKGETFAAILAGDRQYCNWTVRIVENPKDNFKVSPEMKQFYDWLITQGVDGIDDEPQEPEDPSQTVLTFGVNNGKTYQQLIDSDDAKIKRWVMYIRDNPPQKKDLAAGSYCHFYNWLMDREKSQALAALLTLKPKSGEIEF